MTYPQASKSARFLVFAFVTVLMAFVAWRSFWISDDALITFRSVLNLVHGDGFRFNLSERVLASTHPGWAALLSLGTAIGLPVASVSLWLSLLLVLGSLAILVFAAPGRPGLLVSCLLIVTLFASRTFIDFSSSGLETPLTAFLVLTTASLVSSSLIGAAAASGLALLSRIDLIFALALPLAFEWWRMNQAWEPELRRKTMWAALLLVSPTVVVLAASWWYYGYPLPNTAVAKLASSISDLERIQYGLAYWRDSFMHFDPVPLALLVVALPLAVLVRSARALAWAAGGLIHAIYVVWVGGDFMAGRFTHTAFLLSLCAFGFALSDLRGQAGFSVLARPAQAAAWVVLASALVWGGVGSWAEIRNGADFRNNKFFGSGLLADERGFYARYHHWSNFLPFLIASERMHWGATTHPGWTEMPLVTCGSMGAYGMISGPRVHIVDLCGLSDAFLARLRPVREAEWRAGHDFRRIPDGYHESIVQGRNLLTDPKLRPLLDAVWLATRADLKEPARLSAASILLQRAPFEYRNAETGRERALAAESATRVMRARDNVVRQAKVLMPTADPILVLKLSLIANR